MRRAVITHHATTDAQGIGSRVQRQPIAMHPGVKHLVAHLSRLFLGPGIDVVCTQLGIKPFNAMVPLGEVCVAKDLWIEQFGQGGDATQNRLDINVQPPPFLVQPRTVGFDLLT